MNGCAFVKQSVLKAIRLAEGSPWFGVVKQMAYEEREEVEDGKQRKIARQTRRPTVFSIT
jgi:hypothetical protein